MGISICPFFIAFFRTSEKAEFRIRAEDDGVEHIDRERPIHIIPLRNIGDLLAYMFERFSEQTDVAFIFWNQLEHGF